MHAEHAAEVLSDCPNCGSSLREQVPPAQFCPRCGQETILHPPSVAEFAHEFVGHYVALEGPLWRSLRLLVLHPGRLTVEYLRGRRRLYVLPLRLYLSASFVFFLAFKFMALSGGEQAVEPTHGHRTGTSAASAPAPASAASRAPLLDVAVGHTDVRLGAGPDAQTQRILREQRAACEGAPTAASASECSWIALASNRASQRWVDDPKTAQADFVAHALGVAPYVVFLMLPIYAGIVALAYRGRRMLFGEHVVFGMHLHAFWFLAGVVMLALPDAVAGIVPLLAAAHALFALRRVYGGRWTWTVARGAAIGLVYGLLLLLVTMAIAFWLFIR